MFCRVAIAAALALGAACSTDQSVECGDQCDEAGGVPAAPTEIYPVGQRHSPITPAIAENLRAIAARGDGQPDVFAKIGDSITVSDGFLHCFAGAGKVDLDGRTALAATLEQFRAGDAAGTSPFSRVSFAATIGWPAFRAVEGKPSPIDRELAALSPAFAVVMFGTNDIGYMNIHRFGENMWDIADQLAARGVIPILSTIPPRADSASADAMVPHYNAIVRAWRRAGACRWSISTPSSPRRQRSGCRATASTRRRSAAARAC